MVSELFQFSFGHPNTNLEYLHLQSPSVYFNHSLIKRDTVEHRDYQVNIARASMDENTLVVLPTGMGKTIIALIVIAETLTRKKGKILFMAPTKPLVEQHADFIRKFLVPQNIAIFTGEVAPSNRDEMWKNSGIIVSTPQVISNDILADRIDLSQVSLMIFDEAHRAVGDYAYVFIGETYKKHNGRVLAITASPGSSSDKIATVCDNLGITAMELRTEYDADVVNYTHKISINLIEVEMTENAREISGILRQIQDDKKKELQKHGFALSPKPLNMKELLSIQAVIREKLHSGARQSSYFHAITLAAMAMKINQAVEYVESQSIGALRNYMERLETEAGNKGASKATKLLVSDDRIRRVMKLSREVQFEHPKLEKVVELVGKMLSAKSDARIIVFTHYRDVSELVCSRLTTLQGARPVRFVGQATKGDDRGMKQKEQVETIGKFRDGTFNVLVATSVAEEGLDIPSTDYVVFYEPVPSEIRSIQRRGRTGRLQSGRVYILVTKGTRDVPYFWASVGREKKMKKIIALKNSLKDKLKVNYPSVVPSDVGSRTSRMITDDSAIRTTDRTPTSDTIITHERPMGFQQGSQPLRTLGYTKSIGQISNRTSDASGDSTVRTSTLVYPQIRTDNVVQSDTGNGNIVKSEDDFKEKTGAQRRLFDFEGDMVLEKAAIIVDTRELNSEVARELSRLDFRLETKQLETGDYVVSDRVAVERKEVTDFLQSIIDGRLFSQIGALRRAYLRPVVIIEGDGLFTTRNISESAIYGAIASIAVDFGIPIVFTKNGRETAGFLAALYRRERCEKRPISIRGLKTTMSTAERQQFIIEGLPGISGILALRILAHFGTVRSVITADAEALAEVKGIGKTTAEDIVRVLTDKYFGMDGAVTPPKKNLRTERSNTIDKNEDQVKSDTAHTDSDSEKDLG